MSELSDKSDSHQGLKFSYMETEKAMKTVAFSPLVPEKYDYVEVDYATSITEVYMFMIGGSTGTLVGSILITYTDSTKDNIKSVARVL